MFDAPEPGEPTVAALASTLLHAAEAALTGLAHLDLAQLPDEDLRAATLGLERLRRSADAAEAHALSTLHERDATDRAAGHTTSRWLAHHAGLPAGVARRRLEVANRLAALPDVDRSFTDGTIGFDHAAVFADVVNDRNRDAIAPLLPDLIAAADGTVFSRWRADVTALAQLLDADGGHDPADDLARNTFTLSPSDGFLLGRFELTGERALTVADTLHAVADELFHRYARDNEACPELGIPDRNTLLALALEEVCRRGLAVDAASTRPPRVEATLAIHASPGRPEDPTASAVWLVRDRLGSPIPAETLPTFLCDPTFHAAVLDGLGVPVDMGRATRTVTHAQRRALTVRDGGCTFPGCEAPPAWTDAHHVRPWHQQGRTDLSNLALVCRRHHRVAHRRGWSLALDPDGWTRWTSPEGVTLWGQRHGHQRAGP